VSEAQTLRDKALHARVLAASLTDAHAKTALEAMAEQLERKAVEFERQENGGS
jgi:hypothetical protein